MKLNVLSLVVVLAMYTMRTEAILDKERLSKILDEISKDIKDIEEDLPTIEIKEEISQDATSEKDQDIPSTTNKDANIDANKDANKDEKIDAKKDVIIKGHCNNNICDVDRYAELTAALCGYNVFKGEPFSFLSKNNRDPGIENQIFVPATRTKNGMSLTGITASDETSCRGEATSTVITSVRNYQKSIVKTSSLKRGIGFEQTADVEVEPGDGVNVSTQLQLSAGAAFTNNKEMGQVEKFFEDKKGIIVITQAECMTAHVKLQKKSLPKFADGFQNAIKDLVDVNDESPSRKKREFKAFIDEYGTHFMEDVELGARVMRTFFLKDSAKAKFTEDRLEECSTSGFEMNILGLKGQHKTAKCTGDETKELTQGSSSYIKKKVVTKGSLPVDGSIADWAAQTFVPQIIKMDLDPIVNLLSTKVLKRQGMIKEQGKEGGSISEEDAKKMRKWVVPMYNNICKGYGYNCERRNGCGYTDNCRYNENCVDVDKNKGTFTCKSRIDPCDAAQCEQKCGWDGKSKQFTCLCSPGYKLQDDGKSCKKSACKWQVNHAGRGNHGQKKVGKFSTPDECALKCKELKKDNPLINGANLDKSGNCWCQWLMRIIESNYQYDTCYLEEPACSWRNSYKGEGESKWGRYVGKLPSRQDCVLECKKQKKINPKINGVTFDAGLFATGRCFCVSGMNKQKTSDYVVDFDTCYLDCEEELKDCKFPFKYEGIRYYTCANPDQDDNGPWCSTQVDSSGVHVDGSYKYCTSCKDDCKIQLKSCKFPFIYEGIAYNSCANPDEDSDGAWCSTKVDTSGVHVNGNYHYCGKKCKQVHYVDCTIELKSCIFPYIYKGITYNSCANPDKDSNGAWCSTEVDANGLHVYGKYHYCGETCSQG